MGKKTRPSPPGVQRKPGDVTRLHNAYRDRWGKGSLKPLFMLLNQYHYIIMISIVIMVIMMVFMMVIMMVIIFIMIIIDGYYHGHYGH